MTNRNKEDTRPVKCQLCNMKMYYAGHAKHEPELFLAIGKDFDNIFFKGRFKEAYVHRRCVNERFFDKTLTD